MGDNPICPQTKDNKTISCSEMYDVTDGDYELTVNESTDSFEVVLKTKKGGKFEHLDLARYGDASKSETKDGNTVYSCDKSKIGSGAKDCGNIIGMANGEPFSYNGITGYVKK